MREVVTGGVRAWLRLEGAVALVLSVWLYLILGGNVWLLVPLVLLVDVSMVGYVLGPRVGAVTYNTLHTWAPGLVLLGLGAWTREDAFAVAGAILTAHVGMDRVFGYGLKYPTSFADTHLGRIGRPHETA